MAQNTGKARKAKAPSATRRLRLGLGVMLTLLLVVGGKLFLVQGLDVGGMAEAALQNRLTPIELPAERGSILDANGTVLASSVIRYNVVVDQRVNTKTETFRRFDEDDGRTRQGLPGPGHLRARRRCWAWSRPRSRTPSPGTSRYYIVAKDLKPDVEDRISKLQIPGIVTVGTSKRVYPNGSVAGGIVGFLKDGTTGQAGLEQTQDEILKGTPGKRLFEIGADGLRIPVGVDQLTPAVNGKDIKLTLNSDLQYFAQQAIQSQRDKLSAEWGVVIVQDIKTGDIIAMADTNSPDPNDPGKVDAKDRGVRAVTAAYEPGSVEKMITAAALIEEGKSSPLDKFTIPPSYTVDGQTFNDSFAHGTEDRTLAGILGWSMNTGTVMAGQRLSKEQRYDWLKKFGIGEAPDIGLPAEAKGILTPARAMGRPPGVHRAVRPGRLAVHAPDRPGLPKHRQQRRDAPAAADRQLHHPRRHRGEGAGAGPPANRLPGHRPAGPGHPRERRHGGPDQGSRAGRLPGRGEDRHLAIAVRRRHRRVLRLHGVDGGDGADGRSAVYC